MDKDAPFALNLGHKKSAQSGLRKPDRTPFAHPEAFPNPGKRLAEDPDSNT